MCMFEVVPSLRDVWGDPSVSMRAPPPCSAQVVAVPTAEDEELEEQEEEHPCAHHDDETAASERAQLAWGWNTLRLEQETTPEEEALKPHRYSVMLSCCADHVTQGTSLPSVDHDSGASYARLIVKSGTNSTACP
jgi:hypothetical protein